ncbi:hypothetical protein ACFE04_029583 [Oxalis oulophora]
MSRLLSLLQQFLICTLIMSYKILAEDDRKIYIVYMGERDMNLDRTSSVDRHINMLQNIIPSNIAQESHLHSFHRSFDGFVVKLTENEAELLRGTEGVVSVFQSKKIKLHTTRSWDFLGFGPTVKRTNLESDIIVGMFDYGVWPESDSFSDKGFGPPPKKWKGTCDIHNFTCNNKIIGAKFYRTDKKFPDPTDHPTPRDYEGHGTHTASIVAGGFVEKASFFGLGEGTAHGGVPSARIAVYKICWSDGCTDADTLAAFDDAIADGVDILSLSLGHSMAHNYFKDSIAIGTFHAMKRGILTSCSAGNDGPWLATVSNFAPWFLSVAASTIDRKFLTTVQLGDKRSFQGVSLDTFDLKKVMYPLIRGGDAPNKKANITQTDSRFCYANSLDAKLVKGKIVLCDGFSDGQGAYEAGAAGVVVIDNLSKDEAFDYSFPGSHIGRADGISIFKYVNSTRKPTATILRSTQAKDEAAPLIASFSSRGPNPITYDILKPDLAAPGANILAAWSLGASPTGVQGDKRVVPYNIISGTSMACPHVTAIAAYVKSFHPHWSPSAIMSALKTTASPMSAKGNRGAEFAYGSGHINPVKVNDPGLVYDAGVEDYTKFLCGIGYNNTKTPDCALDYIPPVVSNGKRVGKIHSDETKEAIELWKNTLLGCVFGAPPNSHKLKALVTTRWKQFGLQSLIQVNNNLFVFKFDTAEGMYEAIENGPLFIDRRPLMLKRWEPNLKLEVGSLQSACKGVGHTKNECRPVATRQVWKEKHNEKDTLEARTIIKEHNEKKNDENVNDDGHNEIENNEIEGNLLNELTNHIAMEEDNNMAITNDSISKLLENEGWEELMLPCK